MAVCSGGLAHTGAVSLQQWHDVTLQQHGQQATTKENTRLGRPRPPCSGARGCEQQRRREHVPSAGADPPAGCWLRTARLRALQGAEYSSGQVATTPAVRCPSVMLMSFSNARSAAAPHLTSRRANFAGFAPGRATPPLPLGHKLCRTATALLQAAAEFCATCARCSWCSWCGGDGHASQRYRPRQCTRRC